MIHDQFQVDLPEPRPVTTHFRVPVAICTACGLWVQGRDPEQTSEALGAAVQFGPRLLAVSADLKHRLGVSYRKVASLLLTLTGLTVSAGALARSGHRLRRCGQATYDALIEAARTSPAQHVDETGWKVGGRSAWLWVFADAHATLYRIRPSRGHDVVVEVLVGVHGPLLPLLPESSRMLADDGAITGSCGWRFDLGGVPLVNRKTTNRPKWSRSTPPWKSLLSCRSPGQWPLARTS